MALKPSGEERRRSLLQIRNVDDLGEEVVAVQLDERIQVDQNDSQPGDQNDLVSEIVQPLSGRGVDPRNHRQSANHHFNPDAGDDGSQTLQLGRGDPGLCHVDIKCGRQIEKHEPHAVNFARRNVCK